MRIGTITYDSSAAKRAQAHSSTPYRRQQSFMLWLFSKQNGLLCAYECDYGVNYKITMVKTGLTASNMLHFCHDELLIPILSSVIIPNFLVEKSL
jgi:hypothetical protein